MKYLHILFISGLCLWGCQREQQLSPPNVVLILADDLGYNDLACYRAMHDPLPDRVATAGTPHIDKLSEAGMLFTDFYCGAAVCSPSRSSLLTGRNCTRVGIYNWIPNGQPMHLRDEETTLAEMLKPAGYATAHFGKWHLTSEGMGQPLPEDQGYDYSFFTYNNANPSHHNPVNFYRDTIAVGPLEGYSCQLVVDEALRWLENREKSAAPFYINIWFNEPHEKVAAPDSLAARHEIAPQYYGCIENMDHAVGRVMEALEEQGLADNTLVIFSSDNGSQEVASNDPLRGEKTLNLEGGIRVPFLLWWPGHVPAGKISRHPGSFTDVLPTLAKLCGGALPEGRTLDGEDLSEVISGKNVSGKRDKPIFFFRYFHDPVCMLRQGDWVLLGYLDEPLVPERDYDQKELALLKPAPEAPPWSMWSFQPKHMDFIPGAVPEHFQLFNIREDAAQIRDLSDDHPDQLQIMKQEMLTLRAEMIKEGGNWYEDED